MNKEFKAGNWVRHNNGTIFKVKEINGSNFTPDSSFQNFGAEYHISYIKELWKPKLDEWCWFWNENSKVKSFRQFDKTQGSYWTKDLNLKSDFWGYKYCEPFIGTLPSPLSNKGKLNDNSIYYMA